MQSSWADTPLILSLAPTGMVPTRERSAAVPLQPDEIVADVLRCAERGISTVHLHARDAEGRPTHRKDVYARIIAGIRDKRPDLLIGVSCSGRLDGAFEHRSEVLELTGDLKPDLASLTLSSLNFATGASVNEPQMVEALADAMQERGILPEIEVFDLGMVNVLLHFAATGRLKPPFFVNLLFGNRASAQARFLDMGAMISALPPGSLYCLAGLGAAQLPVSAMAAAAAPGIRTGLEDNLWFDTRTRRSASNLQLVERIHDLAGLLGRSIMTPADLRQRLFPAD